MENVSFAQISSNQLINNASIDFITDNCIYLSQSNGLVNSDMFMFKNMTVLNTISVEKVNTYDLSEDFLKTHANQSLQQITFDAPVYFIGDLKFDGEFIDGVNLTDLVGSAVSYNSDTVISGHKSFGNVSMGKENHIFATNATINHIKPEEFVLMDIDAALAGEAEFRDIDVENVTVLDKINGIDLTKFHEDALKYGEDYSLLSDQVFTQDLIINGKFVNILDP